MNLLFSCFWIFIILSIIFGIYELFKKNYELALANIVIPIFLTIFYFLTAMQLPGTLEVDEITFIMQQLQKFHPFAVTTIIILIMFIIVLIWDIKTIMKCKKKHNKNLTY